MAEIILKFCGTVLLLSILDWLICTRGAAYFVDKEYRFKPTIVRYSILLVASAFFVYVSSTGDPAHPWLGAIFILLLILGIYAAVAYIDVKRGLIPDELAERNYADRDY
jgi:hypothetical protein